MNQRRSGPRILGKTIAGLPMAGLPMAGLLMAGLLMLGIVGCSSMKVVTDYSDGIDFMAYETFGYTDSKQNLSTVNPLNHQRVVAAIKREMVAEGFVEVATIPTFS